MHRSKIVKLTLGMIFLLLNADFIFLDLFREIDGHWRYDVLEFGDRRFQRIMQTRPIPIGALCH